MGGVAPTGGIYKIMHKNCYLISNTLNNALWSYTFNYFTGIPYSNVHSACSVEFEMNTYFSPITVNLS